MYKQHFYSTHFAWMLSTISTKADPPYFEAYRFKNTKIPERQREQKRSLHETVRSKVESEHRNGAEAFTVH